MEASITTDFVTDPPPQADEASHRSGPSGADVAVNGQRAIAAGADRQRTRHRIANIAVNVGVDDVQQVPSPPQGMALAFDETPRCFTRGNLPLAESYLETPFKKAWR